MLVSGVLELKMVPKPSASPQPANPALRASLCRAYKAAANSISILYGMIPHVLRALALVSDRKESGHDRESIRPQLISNRRIE